MNFAPSDGPYLRFYDYQKQTKVELVLVVLQMQFSVIFGVVSRRLSHRYDPIATAWEGSTLVLFLEQRGVDGIQQIIRAFQELSLISLRGSRTILVATEEP